MPSCLIRIPHDLLIVWYVKYIQIFFKIHNSTFILFSLGYYQTGTDGYDITWSMPHCVLTLRLIGLAFDHYDGQKKPEELSAHQKTMALPVAPTLIEMCGHVYFPGSFLVGPQFSMRRYLDFVDRKYEKVNLHIILKIISNLTDSLSVIQESGDISQCIRPGLFRAFLGVAYLTVYQVASNFISDYYVTSEDYYELSFLYRVIIIGIWGKVCLYKYISCWLLTEGVCIMSGNYITNYDTNSSSNNSLQNVVIFRSDIQRQG